MLYRLSYVRARVILARDSGNSALRRQCGQTTAACGPPSRLEEVTRMQVLYRRREAGQTMSEYAIVLAVITPAIVAAFALLSDRFIDRLEFVTNFF